MAFTINRNLVFIDSMKFMNSSLDLLVKNLSNNDFKRLSEEFRGDLLKLVKQKGVYPYYYMESFKTFSEDKLPDKCKSSMGDYHDYCLKTDVFLLANPFEKFINMYLNYYELDPCHYFSRQRLSWDETLKMTRIELELISAINMQLFTENGMRGGISYIAKRHSKSSNKYIN